METLLQNIHSKVGENGTPIKKIPARARKDLKSAIKKLRESDHNISNTLLLRTYIASGETIDAKIISTETITAALPFKDILKNTKKLSKKEEIVDAAALFQSILENLSKSKTIKTAKPIVTCICKWQKWVKSFNGSLTEKTEETIFTLINQVVSVIAPPPNLADKTFVKYKNLINPLFEILFDLTLKSKFYGTYVLFIKGVNNIANKYPSLIINNLLSSDRFIKDVENIRERMLTLLEHQILQGNSEKINELYRNMRKTSCCDLDTPFRERLKIIWDTKGAVLDENTQLVIKNILFDEPLVQKKFESFSQEGSSCIRQLATTLINAWEARNDGPRAMDAYNLLSSVLKKYFNLWLSTNVGEITFYNRTAHEPFEEKTIAENAKIIIIRPWVEWQSPEKKTILIKALVKEKE